MTQSTVLMTTRLCSTNKVQKQIVNLCEQKQLVHGREAFSNLGLSLRHAELGCVMHAYGSSILLFVGGRN